MRGKIRWFFPKFGSLLGEPFYAKPLRLWKMILLRTKVAFS